MGWHDYSCQPMGKSFLGFSSTDYSEVDYRSLLQGASWDCVALPKDTQVWLYSYEALWEIKLPISSSAARYRWAIQTANISVTVMVHRCVFSKPHRKSRTWQCSLFLDYNSQNSLASTAPDLWHGRWMGDASHLYSGKPALATGLFLGKVITFLTHI